MSLLTLLWILPTKPFCKVLTAVMWLYSSVNRFVITAVLLLSIISLFKTKKILFRERTTSVWEVHNNPSVMGASSQPGTQPSPQLLHPLVSMPGVQVLPWMAHFSTHCLPLLRFCLFWPLSWVWESSQKIPAPSTQGTHFHKMCCLQHTQTRLPPLEIWFCALIPPLMLLCYHDRAQSSNSWATAALQVSDKGVLFPCSTSRSGKSFSER